MEQEAQSQAQLLGVTQRLLSVAERATGRGLIIEPFANASFRAELQSGPLGQPNRILYRPDVVAHLDHLIAHELGHVLLPLDFSPAENLKPVIDFEAVHADVGADAALRFNWLDAEARAAWETNAAMTLVTVLTSLPEDIVIERSIHKEPQLRALQRASLMGQARELSGFMREQPKRNLPDKVRISAAALEGTWTTWLEQFLGGQNFTQPYGDAGYGAVVNACFRDLIQPASASPRGRRAATDRMAERLGVRRWYRWSPRTR